MAKEKIDIGDLDLGNGRTLLYRYIRGSYAYGLFIDGVSDIDTMSIYINPIEVVLGMRSKNDDYTSDEKNDNIGYDIEKYIRLLSESNPTALESLFIDDDCVIYEHPLFSTIKENRNIFLSKDAIKSLSGYAIEQVHKARGLNKKIVNEVNERKEVIDFCYTFNDKQGTMPIKNWLESRGLRQKYISCSHMPNMERMYACFYDWQEHLHLEWKSGHDAYISYMNMEQNLFFKWLIDNGILSENGDMMKNIIELYNSAIPKGYHGIQKEDGSSCEIRVDKVAEGDRPICYVSYNANGFQTHCRQYAETQEWKLKRNPQRYMENKEKNFDRKNICHCFRLLNMGIELCNTGKLNVNRTNIDRDFLLNIRTGNATYEELIENVEKKKEELLKAVQNTSLQEHVDRGKVNDMLIELRKKFYKIIK